MSDINAAPSSTEPGDNPNWTPAQLAEIQASGVAPMQVNQIAEAGTTASGEIAAAPAAPALSDISATTSAEVVALGATPDVADASAVGGGVDAPSHLMLLDAMLAGIERKIAAGIHTFAHEVTAARDHLAKLL